MFNADLALSVSMTAVSTILSVIMLPANLLLYSKFSFKENVVSQLDMSSLFIALTIVIGAIGLGLYCSASFKSQKFNMLANQLGNVAGICLILFSATMTNSGDADSRIYARHWKFYVAVTLPCIGGLLLSTLIASTLRLRPPERVTVAIECCYQNVGIATSLALSMFQGEQLREAMGVRKFMRIASSVLCAIVANASVSTAFFYGVIEAVIVTLYCLTAWKIGWTKAPENASLCTVLFTSYEVLENENRNGEQIEVSVSNTDGDVLRECSDGSTFTTYFDMGYWGSPSEGITQPNEKPPYSQQ